MTLPGPTHLEPSELGTKEYLLTYAVFDGSWDTTYSQDLQSHLTEKSHTGTIWFADSDASSKTLAFLKSDVLYPPISPNASFLDLGTGNGEMLFLLCGEGGFSGRMIGIDYSSACLQLAYQLKIERGYRDSLMEFFRFDIMKDEHGSSLGQFDVVLDKGTFDAISLSEEKDAAGRRICEGYRDRVKPFVKQGGRFLVTSCNWTEQELKLWFEGEGEGDFQFEGRVDYPKFSFGGKTGQSVSGICFKKT